MVLWQDSQVLLAVTWAEDLPVAAMPSWHLKQPPTTPV